MRTTKEINVIAETKKISLAPMINPWAVICLARYDAVCSSLKPKLPIVWKNCWEISLQQEGKDYSTCRVVSAIGVENHGKHGMHQVV